MPSVKCRAILFDMDGTLVDSKACVEGIWSRWAARHRMELGRILAASHGRRSLDTLREIAPHLDIEQEAAQLDAEELKSQDGLKAVRGAAALLRILPQNTWAVVTSASRTLAALRLRCAGLPIPKILVGGDDVTEGKPSPAGYLIAARLLGVSPEDCLVFEDTPAGILAGHSAGMRVLALTTTYRASDLPRAPTVSDFSQIELVPSCDGLSMNY
jgi:mannitol-1-/sugar-/sorbitol-6-phosphatase